MKYFGPLIVPMLLTAALSARQEVLFVGNSFTHGHENPVMVYNKANITDANASGYGGVPGIFKKLTDQAGLDYGVTIEAVSSQTFSYHLANRATIIADPKWNVVVLQENSTRPLPSNKGGEPALFLSGGDGLQDLILSANPDARVLLYETWASPTSADGNGYAGNLQAMQNDLHDAYYRLYYRSKRTSGKIDFTGMVRVGDAFLRAVDGGYADPNADDGFMPGTFYLWSTGDHRHAGKYGSYLSAVLFYAKITGLDPRDIGAGTGTAAADLGISATHAAQIHLVAYETQNLPEPEPPAPLLPAINRLLSGVSPYNWNNASNWTAGALTTEHGVLIDASSPASSIVANSTQGSPTSSVKNLSFDIGGATKAVQANATVTTTRILNLTGGTDALGGTSLLHLSNATTGTVNIGTNPGWGKLVITPSADGDIVVENAAATLVLGSTSEISGAISLGKRGVGSLVFIGANTFGTGAANLLDIFEGSVVANTAISGANSATGAAGVRVRSAAILSGVGQITPGSAKRVSIDAGGSIAPGPGLGTLTINGAATTGSVLGLASGARLNIELNTAGASDFQSDKISVLNAATGDVVFSGASVDFSDLSAGRLPAGDYVLFTASSGAAYAGLSVDGSGRILSGLTIDSGLDAYNAGLWVVGGSIVARLSPKPYTLWRNRWFTPTEQQNSAVSGDLAVIMGDGISNLMKYAQGLEPKTVAAAFSPLEAGASVIDGHMHLAISYHEALEATDLDYVIEVSSDLNAWYSGSRYTMETSRTNTGDGLTRIVSAIVVRPEHRFARLRITRR
ncbi:hypothetical protein [Rariglobus hedericola]|uniref:Uncharacterized protein n=1 Tax=Rariglobus hedericola TaxID=2597822 RepID=A0A556QLG6_9BACT|nr:hypothetical protein [Rariglobus hedericola]TSJ77476.1 hypothetical protein FPL22_15425 [Rariglobus hedericola]